MCPRSPIGAAPQGFPSFFLFFYIRSPTCCRISISFPETYKELHISKLRFGFFFPRLLRSLENEEKKKRGANLYRWPYPFFMWGVDSNTTLPSLQVKKEGRKETRLGAKQHQEIEEMQEVQKREGGDIRRVVSLPLFFFFSLDINDELLPD